MHFEGKEKGVWNRMTGADKGAPRPTNARGMFDLRLGKVRRRDRKKRKRGGRTIGPKKLREGLRMKNVLKNSDKQPEP